MRSRSILFLLYLFPLDGLAIDEDALWGCEEEQKKRRKEKREGTLPLYGSGLRQARMRAAYAPRACLSVPRRTIRVGVGISTAIPGGTGSSTGWANPSLSTSTDWELEEVEEEEEGEASMEAR